MIAVDSSALIAIAQDEPTADACIAMLMKQDRLLISAGTLAEALIVAAGRDVRDALTRLFDRLDFEIIPVTAEAARRVADAYARWGKGIHPAKLNFGDCFAYEVATGHGCPLLFVGDDFSKTDVMPAL
ncbi:type II toxin-antitoxin system VapC family toxin [soil metagenome]